MSRSTEYSGRLEGVEAAIEDVLSRFFHDHLHHNIALVGMGQGGGGYENKSGTVKIGKNQFSEVEPCEYQMMGLLADFILRHYVEQEPLPTENPMRQGNKAAALRNELSYIFGYTSYNGLCAQNSGLADYLQILFGNENSNGVVFDYVREFAGNEHAIGALFFAVESYIQQDSGLKRKRSKTKIRATHVEVTPPAAGAVKEAYFAVSKEQKNVLFPKTERQRVANAYKAYVKALLDAGLTQKQVSNILKHARRHYLGRNNYYNGGAVVKADALAALSIRGVPSQVVGLFKQSGNVVINGVSIPPIHQLFMQDGHAGKVDVVQQAYSDLVADVLAGCCGLLDKEKFLTKRNGTAKAVDKVVADAVAQKLEATKFTFAAMPAAIAHTADRSVQLPVVKGKKDNAKGTLRRIHKREAPVAATAAAAAAAAAAVDAPPVASSAAAAAAPAVAPAAAQAASGQRAFAEQREAIAAAAAAAAARRPQRNSVAMELTLRDVDKRSEVGSHIVQPNQSRAKEVSRYLHALVKHGVITPHQAAAVLEVAHNYYVAANNSAKTNTAVFETEKRPPLLTAQSDRVAGGPEAKARLKKAFSGAVPEEVAVLFNSGAARVKANTRYAPIGAVLTFDGLFNHAVAGQSKKGSKVPAAQKAQVVVARLAIADNVRQAALAFNPDVRLYGALPSAAAMRQVLAGQTPATLKTKEALEWPNNGGEYVDCDALMRQVRQARQARAAANGYNMHMLANMPEQERQSGGVATDPSARDVQGYGHLPAESQASLRRQEQAAKAIERGIFFSDADLTLFSVHVHGNITENVGAVDVGGARLLDSRTGQPFSEDRAVAYYREQIEGGKLFRGGIDVQLELLIGRINSNNETVIATDSAYPELIQAALNCLAREADRRYGRDSIYGDMIRAIPIVYRDWGANQSVDPAQPDMLRVYGYEDSYAVPCIRYRDLKGKAAHIALGKRFLKEHRECNNFPDRYCVLIDDDSENVYQRHRDGGRAIEARIEDNGAFDDSYVAGAHNAASNIRKHALAAAAGHEAHALPRDDRSRMGAAAASAAAIAAADDSSGSGEDMSDGAPRADDSSGSGEDMSSATPRAVPVTTTTAAAAASDDGSVSYGGAADDSSSGDDRSSADPTAAASDDGGRGGGVYVATDGDEVVEPSAPASVRVPAVPSAAAIAADESDSDDEDDRNADVDAYAGAYAAATAAAAAAADTGRLPRSARVKRGFQRLAKTLGRRDVEVVGGGESDSGKAAAAAAATTADYGYDAAVQEVDDSAKAVVALVSEFNKIAKIKKTDDRKAPIAAMIGLLEANTYSADVLSGTVDGETPLAAAMAVGDKGLVEALLDKGATIDALMVDGLVAAAPRGKKRELRKVLKAAATQAAIAAVDLAATQPQEPSYSGDLEAVLVPVDDSRTDVAVAAGSAVAAVVAAAAVPGDSPPLPARGVVARDDAHSDDRFHHGVVTIYPSDGDVQPTAVEVGAGGRPLRKAPPLPAAAAAAATAAAARRGTSASGGGGGARDAAASSSGSGDSGSYSYSYSDSGSGGSRDGDDVGASAAAARAAAAAAATAAAARRGTSASGGGGGARDDAASSSGSGDSGSYSYSYSDSGGSRSGGSDSADSSSGSGDSGSYSYSYSDSASSSATSASVSGGSDSNRYQGRADNEMRDLKAAIERSDLAAVKQFFDDLQFSAGGSDASSFVYSLDDAYETGLGGVVQAVVQRYANDKSPESLELLYAVVDGMLITGGTAVDDVFEDGFFVVVTGGQVGYDDVADALRKLNDEQPQQKLQELIGRVGNYLSSGLSASYSYSYSRSSGSRSRSASSSGGDDNAGSLKVSVSDDASDGARAAAAAATAAAARRGTSASGGDEDSDDEELPLAAAAAVAPAASGGGGDARDADDGAGGLDVSVSASDSDVSGRGLSEAPDIVAAVTNRQVGQIEHYFVKDPYPAITGDAEYSSESAGEQSRYEKNLGDLQHALEIAIRQFQAAPRDKNNQDVLFALVDGIQRMSDEAMVEELLERKCVEGEFDLGGGSKLTYNVAYSVVKFLKDLQTELASLGNDFCDNIHDVVSAYYEARDAADSGSYSYSYSDSGSSGSRSASSSGGDDDDAGSLKVSVSDDASDGARAAAAAAAAAAAPGYPPSAAAASGGGGGVRDVAASSGAYVTGAGDDADRGAAAYPPPAAAVSGGGGVAGVGGSVAGADGDAIDSAAGAGGTSAAARAASAAARRAARAAGGGGDDASASSDGSGDSGSYSYSASRSDDSVADARGGGGAGVGVGGSIAGVGGGDRSDDDSGSYSYSYSYSDSGSGGSRDGAGVGGSAAADGDARDSAAGAGGTSAAARAEAVAARRAAIVAARRTDAAMASALAAIGGSAAAPAVAVVAAGGAEARRDLTGGDRTRYTKSRDGGHILDGDNDMSSDRDAGRSGGRRDDGGAPAPRRDGGGGAVHAAGAGAGGAHEASSRHHRSHRRGGRRDVGAADPASGSSLPPLAAGVTAATAAAAAVSYDGGGGAAEDRELQALVDCARRFDVDGMRVAFGNMREWSTVERAIEQLVSDVQRGANPSALLILANCIKDSGERDASDVLAHIIPSPVVLTIDNGSGEQARVEFQNANVMHVLAVCLPRDGQVHGLLDHRCTERARRAGAHVAVLNNDGGRVADLPGYRPVNLLTAHETIVAEARGAGVAVARGGAAPAPVRRGGGRAGGGAGARPPAARRGGGGARAGAGDGAGGAVPAARGAGGGAGLSDPEKQRIERALDAIAAKDFRLPVSLTGADREAVNRELQSAIFTFFANDYNYDGPVPGFADIAANVPLLDAEDARGVAAATRAEVDRLMQAVHQAIDGLDAAKKESGLNFLGNLASPMATAGERRKTGAATRRGRIDRSQGAVNDLAVEKERTMERLEEHYKAKMIKAYASEAKGHMLEAIDKRQLEILDLEDKLQRQRDENASKEGPFTSMFKNAGKGAAIGGGAVVALMAVAFVGLLVASIFTGGLPLLGAVGVASTASLWTGAVGGMFALGGGVALASATLGAVVGAATGVAKDANKASDSTISKTERRLTKVRNQRTIIESRMEGLSDALHDRCEGLDVAQTQSRLDSIKGRHGMRDADLPASVTNCTQQYNDDCAKLNAYNLRDPHADNAVSPSAMLHRRGIAGGGGRAGGGAGRG